LPDRIRDLAKNLPPLSIAGFQKVSTAETENQDLIQEFFCGPFRTFSKFTMVKRKLGALEKVDADL
jgi:hypothetical protein